MSRSDGIALVLIFVALLGLHDVSVNSQSLDGNQSYIFPGEVSALLTFRDAITKDPAGYLPSWDPAVTKDICLWAGITCWKFGSVKYLSVSIPSLGGYISPAIRNLTNLRVLDLHHCGLRGTIPDEVAAMNSLVFVRLHYNNLNGSIPRGFGRSTLQQLKLYQNQLEGSIPEDIWNATGLEQLLLFDNLLNGSLPDSIANLKSLRVLRLHGNRFTGPIPSTLGTLTSMRFLDLANNLFSGPIPSTLGNLTAATLISLDNNTLNGTLPSSIWQLKNIVSLSLSDNELYGVIPAGVSNCSQISVLDLHGNMLWGTIPTDLGNASSLNYLDLSSNEFYGTVPDFSGLSMLTYLNISFNPSLTGPFPSIFGSNKLDTLSIQGCGFNGSIPQNLAFLLALKSVNLTDNQFSGTVPAGVQQLLDQLMSVADISSSTLNSTNNQTWLIPLEGNCLQAMDASYCSSAGTGICLLPMQKPGYMCAPPLASDKHDNHTLMVALILGGVLLAVMVAVLAGLGGMLLRLRKDRSVRMSVKSVNVRTGGPIVAMRVGRPAGGGVQQLQDEEEGEGVDIESGEAATGLICRQTEPRYQIGVPQISLSELKAATQDFSTFVEKTPIGEVFLGNLGAGRSVVVTVLLDSNLSTMTDQAFLNEVKNLFRLQHAHLARVVAFCLQDSTRAILTEHVSGGSLYDRLHDVGPSLTWRERMRVAVGVAVGLDYLHNTAKPPSCHGDVKSCHVYLTADVAAKLTSFSIDQERIVGNDSALLSDKQRGSFGYLDPEYPTDHMLTEKSDVYSFGILLYELLTGRMALQDDANTLVLWVRDYMGKELLHKMVDPSIRDQVPADELEALVAIAQGCTWPTKVRRRSIRDVKNSLIEKLGITEEMAAPHAIYGRDEEILEFPQSELE